MSPFAEPALARPAMRLLALMAVLGQQVIVRGLHGVMMIMLTASFLLVSTARAQPAAGDANDDGSVNADDIPAIVAEILGTATAPGDPDCTGDNVVDVLDTVCVFNISENNPPLLNAIDDRSVREGQPVALVATASDADLPDDELTWVLTQAPAGTSLAAIDGSLLWVPTADQLGPNNFSIRVFDTAGAFDEATFTVDVRRLGSAPQLTAIADQDVLRETLLEVFTEASDPDLPDDKLNWSLDLAPPGMSINSESGAISWIPTVTQVGLFDATVRVSDSEGLADIASFTIRVRPENTAPKANDDLYTARIGETLTIEPAGVLQNDSDPNGDLLNATLVSTVARGVLDFRADGSFDYTPELPEVVGPVELELQCDLADAAQGTNGTVAVGDLDNDGTIEIVGAAHITDASTPELWVMNARDCSIELAASPLVLAAGGFTDGAQLGLLDIDGNGDLEIIGPRMRLPLADGGFSDGKHLLAVHHNGTLAWPGDGASESVAALPVPGAGSDTRPWDHAGPTFADLDGDGTVEIIMTYGVPTAQGEMGGIAVFNSSNGSLLWEFNAGAVETSSLYKPPVIADLDQDGSMEIIFHSSVVDHLGVLEFTLPSALPAAPATPSHLEVAVANLDADPEPELIARDSAFHYVFEHDGTLKWQQPAANTSQSPLTVADFDADGELEFAYHTGFGVAGSPGYMTVFDTDGTLLWSHQSDPAFQIDPAARSRGPGTTAFDANDDGAMDLVVHYDFGPVPQSGVYIFDGLDGSVLEFVEMPGTVEQFQRFVTIVDVDDDGEAEIISSYHDGGAGATRIWQGSSAHPLPAAPAMRDQWQFNAAHLDDRRQKIITDPTPHWLLPRLNGYNLISTPNRVYTRLQCELPLSTGLQHKATIAAGDVDNDGTTEILGVRFAPAGGGAPRLWIVNAEDCTEQPMPSNDHVDAGGMTLGSHIGLLDIDGDGDLEIIGTRWIDPAGNNPQSNNLIAVHHDGTLAWPGDGASEDLGLANSIGNSSDGGFTQMGPTFADLDGNGTIEIIMPWYTAVPAAANGRGNGMTVFNAVDGSILWEYLGTVSASDNDYKPPTVVDLDLDGTLEIIFHTEVLDHEGQVEFELPVITDGVARSHLYHAVANFDDDPWPEIVARDNNFMYLFEHDGTLVWSKQAVNNSQSQIAVADFDGDRELEFAWYNGLGGFLTRGYMEVYEADGSLLWTHKLQPDLGEDITRLKGINPTAFDANGDGAVDIVVHLDLEPSRLAGVYIFDGRDGAVLEMMPIDSTATEQRFTTIADLDNDGQAEIVSSWTSGLAGETRIWEGAEHHPLPPAPAHRNQWIFNEGYADGSGNTLSNPMPHWLQPGLNGWNMIRQPLHPLAGTTDSFTYLANDGALDSNVATVTFDVQPDGTPPVFLTQPDTLTTTGFQYEYAPWVVDIDPGDAISFILLAAPPGMTIEPLSGVVRWLPAAAGAFSVTILASDTIGFATPQAYTLLVGEPVTVPDVIGQQEAMAESALTGANLVVGQRRFATHPSIAAGEVSSQTPIGGSVAEFGGTVDLVMSLGPAPEDIDSDGDGFTPNQGDCDDDNPAIYPGAAEIDGDGIDQDCDGIDGTQPIVSIIIEPADLHLLAGESVQLRAWAMFADGTAQIVTQIVNWDSSSNSTATVGAGGLLLAVGDAGSASITATRNAITGSATVTVTDRILSDYDPPEAQISSPADGEVVFGPMDIIGTAFDDNLVRFELALSPAGEDFWTLIHQGTSTVDHDVLGVFDPTVVLNGFYDIRLRVVDAGGNESIDKITVQADGEQKVGLFTLTLTDLTVPLGGLPITIERVYDSRDRSMGDFGMGWRLGLRSIELTCSSKLGEDWFVAKSGLSFSLLPMREKACAISLPGGRMEVFDFDVSPSNSPFVPFLTVTGQLQPRPGTLGQIEILDNTNLLILEPQPGEVLLFDDVTFAPFNPVELRYTMPDGTVFEFTDGRVSRVIDVNGNSLEFSLTGIEHSSGTGVDFARDVLGRITAITDPSGNTQTYAYSANGDLIAHADALGYTTRFFYNSRHGLLRIEDPLGNSAIRSEYDERGRLIALIDATGNRTEHEYDDDARLQSTTFPDGSTRVVAYDERGNIQTRTRLITIDGNPVFSEEAWEYDEFGNPTRTVDADGVVENSEWNDAREWTRRVIDPDGLELVEEQEFDLDGLLIRSIDALGRERQYQYDSRNNVTFSPGPGGVDFSLSYDASGRLGSLGDPRGDLIRLEYNSAGQVIARETRSPQWLLLTRTEFELDANGRVIGQTKVGLADGESSRTTTLTRDAMGRVLSVINPLGETTWFEYDAIGNVTAIIDPLGARTEMDYDERGLMVERRLADGGVEIYDFDHAGRQVLHVDPDGVTRETAYDELGRAVAERLDGQLMVRRIYSPGGRLVAEIDAYGNRTDFEYDGAGRMIRTLLPEVFDAVSDGFQRPEVLMEYNALGQRTAMLDPLGRRTEYVYDDAGYLSRVIHPDGSERLHLFDAAGRHLAVTDEEGHSTLFDYDAAGRLIRVTQPPPEPGQPHPETFYFYDSFGQLRSRIDALSQVTAFEYDAAGRQTRKIMPDGTSEDFEYDAAGRRTRVIDFDGTELLFSHDALGRLLSRTGPGLVESISYTAAGRRATANDSRGLTIFNHDGHGRLAGFTEGDGLGIDYAYDANGRLIGLTLDGHTTEYAWDAVGRLAAVTTDAGTVNYAYDLAGQLVSKTLPNGVVHEVDYDLRGRPLAVSLRDSADTMIEQFTSTYSPRGQRLSLSTSDGTVETYDYDPIGRLIEAERLGSDPFALAFEYDPAGNRLRQVMDGVETLYSYGPNHELLAVGGDSFDYDPRGNRIAAVSKGQAITYQWDAFGRLTGVTTPDGQAAFQYDVDDRRVARVVDGDRTRQLIDPRSVSGFSQVVAEYDDAGQIEARWHYGRQLLTQERQGQVHHYGIDHRGSVALLTDAAGQVTDRYGYLPFGDLNAASGSTLNPYRFNAERYEPAALAYDLRQRSYDTCSGTFVSRDPFPGYQNRPFSLHPYQFGDADPINHIDPLGLFTLPELSIGQSIQGGLRKANFISKARTLCKAQSVTGVVNTITAASQIAAFALNVASAKADFKIAFSVPLSSNGTKFTLEINPDFGLSNPAERSFEIKASIEEDGRTTPAMGVKVTPNAIIASGGLGTSIDLVEVSACGKEFAKLSLKAELTAETGVGTAGLSGKTTFKAQLALGFAKAAFGVFDSGGVEWTFLEISRASNQPPVNKYFEP